MPSAPLTHLGSAGGSARVKFVASPSTICGRGFFLSSSLAAPLTFGGFVKNPQPSLYVEGACSPTLRNQPDRVSRGLQVDFVARPNAILVGNRLGDGELPFAGYLGHRPYFSKDTILVK